MDARAERPAHPIDISSSARAGVPARSADNLSVKRPLAHGHARWDFVAVSNIVPDPGLPADQLSVRCGLCGAPMTLDHRGGLCTGPTDCVFVCDRCGDAEAPAEMALVRELRVAGAYTVTVDGADPDQDPFAWTCPVCDKDLPEKPTGWHIVDTAHGRPVCQACAPTLDAHLHALAEQLNLREQQYEARSTSAATTPGDGA